MTASLTRNPEEQVCDEPPHPVREFDTSSVLVGEHDQRRKHERDYRHAYPAGGLLDDRLERHPARGRDGERGRKERGRDGAELRALRAKEEENPENFRGLDHLGFPKQTPARARLSSRFGLYRRGRIEGE